MRTTRIKKFFKRHRRITAAVSVGLIYSADIPLYILYPNPPMMSDIWLAEAGISAALLLIGLHISDKIVEKYCD